jgi:phosphopantetheine binding protein
VPAETHVRGRGGGDTRGVAEVVWEVVAEATARPVEALSADDRLSDLGVSDLVLVDVVETVGEELGERTVGLDLDDEALTAPGTLTLGELAELVAEALGTQS